MIYILYLKFYARGKTGNLLPGDGGALQSTIFVSDLGHPAQGVVSIGKVDRSVHRSIGLRHMQAFEGVRRISIRLVCAGLDLIYRCGRLVLVVGVCHSKGRGYQVPVVEGIGRYVAILNAVRHGSV